VCSSDLAADQYVLSVFSNHASTAAPLEGHFFRNEAEYVIEGGESDSGNYKGVKTKLTFLRFAMNCEHIATDKEKQKILAELSEAGGPYEGAALAGLISGWAAAETHNDLLRLDAGEKVALIKTARQWALNDPVGIFKSLGDSLAEVGGSIFDYDYTGEAVEPEDKGGWDYAHYLRLLLFLTDRRAKLLRIEDLIQINMKGTYRSDFLMREYYTGFSFDAVVDGDGFHYEEKY
jgi:hypothetical protein